MMFLKGRWSIVRGPIVRRLNKLCMVMSWFRVRVKVLALRRNGRNDVSKIGSNRPKYGGLTYTYGPTCYTSN